MSLEAKKLVSVLATFTLVTMTREEIVETAKALETAKAVQIARTGKNGKESKGEYPENLAQVLCIRYPIIFQKDSVPISAFFDSGSKVNAIHPTFVRELGLLIRPTNVEVQKIDSTTLDIFGMVVAAFLVMDKANWVKFLEETFLIANVSPKVVLGILFLTLSGVNIDFLGREL